MDAYRDDRDLQTARQHVQLLAVFHWVLAGLTLLFALVPLLYVGIGALMLRESHRELQVHDPEGLRVAGRVMVAIGFVLCAMGIALAVGLALAGYYLRSHKNRTFCMVVAGIVCLWVPLGTVLGVFTLIVLSKPAAQALFDPQLAYVAPRGPDQAIPSM